MRLLPLASMFVLLWACDPATAAKDVWPPPEGVPMTAWGKEVTPDKPVLPEYPRPQLVRAQWLNLNGLWDYSITPREANTPGDYRGKILVPFPIESVLSQVNQRVDEKSRLWYHRTFQVPSSWRAARVLLHFGAVDWETTVSINGNTFPAHRGGYDGFSFDVTDALSPAADQQLVVSIWDPTEGGQPRGKQSRIPEGIFYTPTTGIWQTVWLEPVPKAHIKSIRMIPDVDNGRLNLSVAVAEAGQNMTIVAAASAGGREAARATGKPDESILLPIPSPRLWGPDDPFLYDLQITLKQGDASTDAAASYFGMRKISIGPDEKGRMRMLLNTKFVFENGFLDQGFWPDGIYTAPTDEALRSDIAMTRQLGFNMARKHIKVEPDRWYFWADKLGLLVWQDMPASLEMCYSGHKELIPDRPGQFELELQRMVQGRFNHPSIITWVLFNEGMGLEMGGNETPSDQTRAIVRRMVDATRSEDPTRLINHESGAGGGAWQGKNPWDLGLGDIVDYHCYGDKPGPMPEKNRAAVVGEYGWGVGAMGSVGRLLPEIDQLGVSALVLTQLTDVENEKNGVLTYDRKLKGDLSSEQFGTNMREQIRKGIGQP